MSFRSEYATYYLEVLCMHYPVCDQKGTQFWLIVAGAMLAQLLIRRITSKQIVFAENAFRCSISSKYHSLSPAKDVSSQACRTTLDLQTFAYRIHSAKGPANPMEVSPLMKGFVSSFSGKGLSRCKPMEFTATRSLWIHGSPQKGFIHQRRWGGVGNSRVKMPKQDTVRGFSTSNTFGLSQAPMWGLVIVNFSVYFLWQTQERHWMIRNWMVSVDSVLRGRLHTMLTYSISNNRLDHIVEDMLGLYFFGGEIARIYGGSYMLMVYLVGAIAGSVGHLAYCTFLVPWLEKAPYDDFNYSMTPYILGAAAPTNALVVIHVLLFPHHIILANYLFPVPAIVFGAYLLLADIYDMYQDGTRTTHAGAVAGALSGIPFWLRIRRGITKKKRGIAKKKG